MAMTTPQDDEPARADRTEHQGGHVISGAAEYLPDVQVWSPRIIIERSAGDALPFVVPCGPECYRKDADEALNAGWAAARHWLDGGKIPWKARPADDTPADRG